MQRPVMVQVRCNVCGKTVNVMLAKDLSKGLSEPTLDLDDELKKLGWIDSVWADVDICSSTCRKKWARDGLPTPVYDDGVPTRVVKLSATKVIG